MIYEDQLIMLGVSPDALVRHRAALGDSSAHAPRTPLPPCL
ncbi:hypothetical protein [Streptosporangium subroseum]|nr:hypothetical protein OHB15_35785 [Streptosporangium subroseum]